MSQSIAWVNKSERVIESTGESLPVYSLTKTFIAAAILAMQIDLNAPISTWIEPALVPRAAEITVEQLLNHTSGIRDYGSLPAYRSAINSHQPAWTDDEFADQTLRAPLLFEPGAGWSYSNPGFWLLSQIAQRQSGLSFDGVIQRYITIPLGLNQTIAAHGLFSESLSNYPAEWVWHGLLLSTAEDVARFMASELVQPLSRRLVRVPYADPHWTSPHYGYGLMVDPGIRFGHNGGGPGFTASCFHFLPDGLTGCVIMSSEKDGAAFEALLGLLETKRRPQD